MKHILFLSLFCSTFIFGQVEKEVPLLTNPDLQIENANVILLKSGATFDSTFVYTTDTLSLPFFDDFSKNHFQKYHAQVTDPGVTSQEIFALLDLGSVPLPANSVYSTVPTYTRYINAVDGTFTDTNFASINVQVGSLVSYPVTHNTTPLYPPYIIFDTIGTFTPDTLYVFNDLVKQDSATQFFKQINDKSKYWLDERAYHNYRFAKNPWTIGVATFDGLDQNGYPYSFGSSGSDYADALTSKPFKMESVSPSDSVYLTFIYQKQGFGEEPEIEDKLVLELFDPILLTWNQIWNVNGGPVADFQLVHLPILDSNYFNNGFQFRFRNYGSLAGGLDHFHVDYIKMKKNAFYDDVNLNDFAFVYPTGSMIKEYTSVPWDHYKNNPSGKMNDSTLIVVRNGSNTAQNNQNGSVQISYNGVPEVGGNFTLIAQTLSGGNINYAPLSTYFSYHDLSGGYQFDITKPGTKQTFDIVSAATAQFADSTVNDTTFTQQYFANYYSYDDGTAERAYSLTGAQARLAMKFTPYESDSLIGASIHFTPSVVDASGDLFVLNVWEDNGGIPGSVLYSDSLFIPKEVKYVSGTNRFVNYFFDDTTRVKVNGSFFIGWRQFDPEPLNVGLDKNNNNSDKLFYSLNGGSSWTNSIIEGTVMIRPIFSTSLNAELSIKELPVEEEVNFLIYPNPATNEIRLKASNGVAQGMQIFNLQGQLVMTTDTDIADISELNQGVYLVRPSNSKQTLRLIKK
jgi:hypothetical protein